MLTAIAGEQLSETIAIATVIDIVTQNVSAVTITITIVNAISIAIARDQLVKTITFAIATAEFQFLTDCNCLRISVLQLPVLLQLPLQSPH